MGENKRYRGVRLSRKKRAPTHAVVHRSLEKFQREVKRRLGNAIKKKKNSLKKGRKKLFPPDAKNQGGFVE